MKNGDARGQTGISPTVKFEPEEIKQALDRILRSDTFARSERSRELLHYVIERDLEGEADRLKGFAIALDVFDREDNFDPSTDAVVRVQAGRLRDLLDSYYEGEGANDAIRISIPRGSYVPAYERLSCGADGPVAGRDDPAFGGASAAGPAGAIPVLSGEVAIAGSRRVFSADMRLVWAAVALVILLLSGNVLLLASNGLGRADQVPAAFAAVAGTADLRPASAPSRYLPSVSIEPGVDGALRSALEDAIPRFGSVVYVAGRADPRAGPASDFYIRGVASGANSVNLQLYHRESGILIGTDQVPGGLDADAMEEHISRITSRFLPVGGVIYAFLETEGRLNPFTNCLVLSSAYFNNQSEERHYAAYRCFEQLQEDGINSGLVHAGLASLTVEVVTDGYSYPADVDLADAVAHARRGVELAPGSALAHRALARTLQVSGATAAALDMVREANALNPYDLGIAASYGSTLIASGDFRKAVEVMERATKAAPVHPTWWDFSTFVAAFQEGRNDLVSLSARNLVGHQRSHYCAARLIAANLEGDDALRKKMLKTLAEREDQFFEDPGAFYSRIMPEAAAEKLVSALRDAGFSQSEIHGG